MGAEYTAVAYIRTTVAYLNTAVAYIRPPMPNDWGSEGKAKVVAKEERKGKRGKRFVKDDSIERKVLSQ